MQATGTYSSPQEILKTYWGYDQFRPQQLEVIEAVLAGRDVLTLLPTGAGFFFGSTTYDEYYYGDLQETIEIIDRCLASKFNSFEYQASW